MKKAYKILSLFLAVVLFIGCFAFYTEQEAGAVTKAEINKLKQQAKEIDNKISGVQAQIDELKLQQVKTLAQKELYDEQCTLITEQISITEQQIEEFEELTDAAEKEYEQAIADEEAQYELMRTRIRAMEENGVITYWQILFDSNSFADLLSRMDFIGEIMNFDEQVIEDYQVFQRQTMERKQELLDVIDETEAMQDELEVQKVGLEEKLAEAQAHIEELHADQEVFNKLKAEYEAEEDALDAKIAEAERKYAAQIAAQQRPSGGGASIGNLKLQWPCSSRRITSYFGYRSAGSTNGVGSTNHKGIDIGAVGYTTPIVAVAAGTVTISQYSRSAGEYVAVSHGNGVRSVYMHLSSRAVTVGQTVSKGQKLGISGSTGNSTGPHLHFGLIVNGVYVDPLKYLP